MLQRRDFLSQLCVLGAALTAPSLRAANPDPGSRPRRLLLRSSWQTVNIGDIGHTPGVLRLLEEHLPGVDVRLWPMQVGDGVEAMLRNRFPKVPIVQSSADAARSFEECDFLLHGSGPSIVARKDLMQWSQKTGKPYGIYGVTWSGTSQEEIDLISKARFAYFRDSVSLELARSKGTACPVLEFGPDGAFAVDLKNDEAAEKFLAESNLTSGLFLCCIPRYRHTPYWTIPAKKRPFDEKRDQRNQEMKEHDHAPLREAITAVARQTPLKVLICPEDVTQVAIGKEMLFDKLPEDVQKKTVWRSHYWLTDEALSIYRRSAGLFGLEMHSPILCIGNGIPALVGRFHEQTSKGFMWRDIGLGDWLFDMDQPDDVAKLVPAVLELARNPAAARTKTQQARAFVQQRQRETMEQLKKNLAEI